MKSESLFALIAGAAAGVAIGLLFAPEKGEETRKKIKEAAKDGYDMAREGILEKLEKLEAALTRETDNDIKADA
ncbi:MAG: YtxH domain-containing protein [Candidatus Cryptobacteroides sp.]